jgi:hypothetical protein
MVQIQERIIMQKQAFLGTAIGGAIIGQITNAIVDNLISAPAVPVSRDNSVIVKPEVREAVAKEVGPVIDHLTNNEPFYKSRISWGALFAILGGIATIGTAIANGDTTPEVYTTAGMSILGGITTLYGRWKARKPLGAA